MKNRLSESILSELKESSGNETYKVFIEETVVGEFSVEASSDEEAFDIAMEKYKTGEFVLEPGEVQSKQMMVENPDGYQTNWIEF